MNKFFLSASALALMIPAASRAADISMSQVVLQGLDKVTGRLSTMTVNAGEKTQFGALDIYARVCYAHPPEEVPENAAFLEIVEKKPAGEAKVFSGWMFSSSPALSAMEHPVYDVWVLSCQGEPFKAPIPEPLVLEHPIPVAAPVSKLKAQTKPETQKATEEQPKKEAVEAQTAATKEAAQGEASAESATPAVATDAAQNETAAEPAATLTDAKDATQGETIAEPAALEQIDTRDAAEDAEAAQDEAVVLMPATEESASVSDEQPQSEADAVVTDEEAVSDEAMEADAAPAADDDELPADDTPHEDVDETAIADD